MRPRPYWVLPLLLAASAGAHACGETLAGARTTVENSGYTIVFATAPSPVEVGKHFTVDFAVCPRAGAAKPQAVRVDANMPEHRHGMNYRPRVTTTAPGVYRGEGLLFHMPGRWDVTFDVVAGNTTQRLTSTLRVE
jgi:YtkA-like